MSFKIISSLSSGGVSSLLEVFAILLGLLIAGNLQAIVSLSARRRLYSHGTVRLRDSTWNVGVLQGLVNPFFLFRDIRAILAFFLALTVIALEVLTVFQTEKSDSCDFAGPSDWKVQESSQKCFSPTADIESEMLGPFLTGKFVSSAQTTAQRVDLNVGIPAHTNIFEKSVVTGKAVKQLTNENHVSVYTAPVIDRFNITGYTFIENGIPNDGVTESSGKDEFKRQRCLRVEEQSVESYSYIARNAEFQNFQKNRSLFVTAATGFVHTEPCLDVLVFRICDYEGGRKEFNKAKPGFEPKTEVVCEVLVISREGRKTSASSINSALYGANNIDESAVRRAVLASIIAQNSASTVPCTRYLAVPKHCTEIGVVSLFALFGAVGLFILTSIVRIGLRVAARNTLNFNGSPEKLARAMFNHFEGPKKPTSYARPGRLKKRELLFGQRVAEEDIHLSIAEEVSDPDHYRLIWTRGPSVRKISPYVPISSIRSHANEDEEQDEVLLV